MVAWSIFWWSFDLIDEVNILSELWVIMLSVTYFSQLSDLGIHSLVHNVFVSIGKGHLIDLFSEIVNAFFLLMCCWCSNYLVQVKAVVIGLGAGLLPMFLHGCLQFMQIEVIFALPPQRYVELSFKKNCFFFFNKKLMFLFIGLGVDFTWWNFVMEIYLQAVELDPSMVNLAKDYFGFTEDNRLKVTNFTLVHH